MKKEVYLKDSLKTLLGVGVGFLLFWVTSNPKSPVHKKLPPRKIKNVHLLPHVKIVRRDTAYHLHHWFNMTSLYIGYMVLKRRMIRSKLLNGFIVGSIMQGLIFPDSFRFRHKTHEMLHEK